MAIFGKKQEISYPRKKECFAYPSSLFPIDSSKKLFVDIGPGRGDFLFHLAKTNPDALAIGVEIKPNRVNKIIANIKKIKLDNAVIIEADASNSIDEIFDKSSIKEIYISFPDPWPKRRHIHNRILKKAFIKKCETVLSKNGRLIITTDVKEYAIDASKEIDHKNLMPVYPEIIRQDTDEVFPTFFYNKWKKMGRTAYIQIYMKK